MTIDPKDQVQEDIPAAAEDGLSLRVQECASSDSGRGLTRVDLPMLRSLGASVGDILRIEGRSVSYARAMPLPRYMRGRAVILLDRNTRQNASATLEDTVNVSKAALPVAKSASLLCEETGFPLTQGVRDQLARVLENVPLAPGHCHRVRMVGRADLPLRVTTMDPSEPCLIGPETRLHLSGQRQPTSNAKPKYAVPAFENLGGLTKEIERVREMVELPLKRPDLFQHLGMEAPRGVLLSGPPGTGKTLLARAVAQACDATFFQINGPEIVNKHYGESEKALRDIFRKAEQAQPAVVFIDEIDAIAPNREKLAGDRQVERRIVGQLLTLMDGLDSRGQVVVMGATNLPNELEPALRRPGRFDREIAFPVPDKTARVEILKVTTRAMPLAADVDLQELAALSHGFVGADLAALTREAGMAAIRRVAGPDAGLAVAAATDITVERDDFLDAQRTIVPSAIREVFTEIPETGWADIGGHEEAKRVLQEAVVWPLTYPDLFEHKSLRPTRGVLLAGPPGTGKTLLARALAHESGLNFIPVRGPQLLSQYVGESERAVRDVFRKARRSAPCILFFDELDALVAERGSAGAVLDRVVGQFLNEIDGIEDQRGVFVLAATNRADQLDPALLRPGRFDCVLPIGLPDGPVRAQVLAIHTQGLHLEPEVNLNHIAADLEGASGADLAEICRAAGMSALRRTLQAADASGTPPDALPPVSLGDFEHALALRNQSRTAAGGQPSTGDTQ